MLESQRILGEKLRELRNKKGETKKEIANVMGISVYKYAKIEKGEGVFFVEQARRLVEYYGICLDDLIKYH